MAHKNGNSCCDKVRKLDFPRHTKQVNIWPVVMLQMHQTFIFDFIVDFFIGSTVMLK